MNETPIVRIQRASIKNFRNVESGDIRFPCNYGEDIFAPKADVLGIYGQNGSGKTTFIDALEILKTLLSGQKVTIPAIMMIYIKKCTTKLPVGNIQSGLNRLNPGSRFR